MRFTATIVLMFLLTIASSCLAQNSEMAGAVRDVLSNKTWSAEAKHCPAKYIAQAPVHFNLSHLGCKSGKLQNCLSKCQAGNGGSCYWLAVQIQQSQPDSEAVQSLFQRSCKLGVMSGCTNRAAEMTYGLAVSQSAERCATQTYSKACAFDDPWACSMYALQLTRGAGVAKDDEMALKVLEKSCKYGPEDPACSNGMELREKLLKDRGDRQRK
jgi:hypothetical protein